MTTKQAVDKLRKSLKEDEGYYQSWKANIAMAFVDTITQDPTDEFTYSGIDIEDFDIKEIANISAERFLKQLIS